MKRFFIFYGLLFILNFGIFAQGEVDKQKTLFYRNEKSGGILLNSNGFGINGLYAKRIDAANKILYGIDLVYIRHPKEEKTSSQFGFNSSNFVLGKQYLAINLRPAFGRQKEIFRKFDIGGISVRRFYMVGASLAILKPIYYNVDYVFATNEYITKVEKFSRNIFDNPSRNVSGSSFAFIESRASFFKGFDELKLIPGAFLKFGIDFEYSRFDQVLHAVETGIIVEGFTQQLPIMATKENPQLLLTLFLSYRIGKVFDPNAPKKAKKKDDFLY